MVSTSTCFSANWKTTGSLENGDETYLDTSSIVVNYPTVTFWWLTNFQTPKLNKIENKYASSFLDQFQMNCSKRTTTLLYFTEYTEKFRKGDLIYSAKPDRDENPIVPGSIMEEVMRMVCKK